MLGYNKLWIFLGLAQCIAAQSSPYRLPISVHPVHYSINIDTNLDSGTFSGRTIIELAVSQSVNQIVLHSKDLAISSLQVDGVLNSFFTLNTTTDFLIIQLNEFIPANMNRMLRIDYTGTLNTENVGYYVASYLNDQNHVRRLAVTQFQSTNARRAFPCFDEPHLKATFQISLTRLSTYITSSNTYLTHHFPSTNNRVTDVYAKTERMSTYLVAFMVSDFRSISSLVNPVTYRTFARPEQILNGNAAYSLTIPPQAIWVMENITGVPYVLSTLDQVAVPNDYSMIGGMESWGMITYRERYLMYNEINSTAAEKQFITTTITHGLAHQWFGNLVTPDWWNYVWLNEGFATYFEMWATAQFIPSWNLMEQFVVDVAQSALAEDSLESTNTMSREVNSPAEINAIHDTIVYKKAAAIIRMAHTFLGDIPFRIGLTRYLEKWEFLTVNPQRLYERWQETTTNPFISIADIMSSWEVQEGYPVVTVTRLSNGTIASQERFLLHRAEHHYRTLWHIPLNFFTLTATFNTITWLTEANRIINVNVPLTNWVIFNINQAGFYRVNYDDGNWRLIINYLRTGSFGAIPVSNRAQLVDDAFNLARSQRLNLSVALDVGSYIQNETEYAPIRAFTNALRDLELLSIGLNRQEVIQNYGRTILEGYFNRSGFIEQNDPHLTKLTKVAVLTWLCRLGHAGCRNNSIDLFQRWINQATPIQADSQNFVYCNGLRTATNAVWETTLQRYGVLREDTQRNRIAIALGCTNNQALLQRILDLVIEPNSVIGLADRVPAVQSVYTNNGVLGVNLVLQWLNRHFPTISDRVGGVKDIINGVARRITTNEQASLFSTFVDAHALRYTPALNSTLASANGNIQSNLDWINDTSPQFEEHFSDSSSVVYCQILLIISCMLVHLLYE